jgi:hypothetical protein
LMFKWRVTTCLLSWYYQLQEPRELVSTSANVSWDKFLISGLTLLVSQQGSLQEQQYLGRTTGKLF